MMKGNRGSRTGRSRTARRKAAGRGPLISIITVCRNSESTLARTIESVLHQTYPHIEYILVDGASTDGTVGILRSYEPKFKGRMRWISEADHGIYDAMNKGIGLARGAVIGTINSDDWYELNAVQLVADAYLRAGDAVFYGILRVFEEGREVMLKATRAEFLHRDVVGHPAYFVAKRIYEEHGRFCLDYRYASDYELMLRFLSHHIPFVQIDNVLANFSQGGASARHGLENLEEYYRIRFAYSFLSKRGFLVRILKCRLLSLLKWMRIDV